MEVVKVPELFIGLQIVTFPILIKSTQSTLVLTMVRFRENILPKMAEVLINLSCLGFVLFQGTKCIIKYLDQPNTTNLSYESIIDHPYPTITICNHPWHKWNDFMFNKNELHQCGIPELEDYYEEGNFKEV